jgi:hypothetical protein
MVTKRARRHAYRVASGFAEPLVEHRLREPVRINRVHEGSRES